MLKHNNISSNGAKRKMPLVDYPEVCDTIVTFGY